MKILLIYPHFLENRLDEEDISTLPMGLYSIGAVLIDHHHQVEILNWYDIQGNSQLIHHTILSKKPDLIGLSILHGNRWGGIEVARIAKQIDAKITVVFGGAGATFLWDHLLKHFSEIDYIVLGEGEYTLLELVGYIEKRDRKNGPDRIKGIAFRKEGIPFKTESREKIKDLDSLPMPSKYFSFKHLSLTRGCPSDCTFCGSPLFWERKVRFHSADYFVGQMERLLQRGVSFFFISDDTFTLRKRLVITICKKILDKKLNVTWAAISRVDCVDEEVLLWMRRAGCVQISFGVESGSGRIRKLFNKNIKADQIETAFAAATRCGIMPRAYFIYGAPCETRETIKQSLDLIKKIKPLGAIFYILDIFPGTALYSDFKSRTGADDDIWLKKVEDILYFETDPCLTDKMVLEFGKMLREGFFKALPDFANQIELIDNPDLYPLHADFLSRLALTFSHGDYAANPLIPDRMEIAVKLNKRALSYFPDHRAFWGLGMIHQQMGRVDQSIAVLLKGISHYPERLDMARCLGAGLMRVGRFEKAMSHLLKFQEDPGALQQMIHCSRALKDFHLEKEFMGKLRKIGRHT